MHLASRRALWSTFVAAAVFVTAIALMGFAAPVTHTGAHAITAVHATAAATHSNPTHINQGTPIPGNASGTVVITSAIPVYLTIPYVLTWAITVHNASPIASEVTQTVTLTYSTIRPNVVIWTQATPLNPITPLVGSQTLNASTLATSKYANGALLEGSYILTVTLVVTNTSQAVPQPFTTTASAGVQLAAHFPTGHFFNPIVGMNTNVTTGTVTVSGEYNGSFVNSANVTVYNSTNVVVFVQGVFAPQTAPNAQEGFSVNVIVLAGTYTAVLTLGAPYNHAIVAQSDKFTAVAPPGASGTTRYVNTTNTSGGGGLNIAGLGSGGSGALLLVLGLVVGMIVALLVARGTSMGAAAGPAQPWSGQSTGSSTTMANECSVCHQTFATADELKEHSKSQHGITM